MAYLTLDFGLLTRWNNPGSGTAGDHFRSGDVSPVPVIEGQMVHKHRRVN